MTNQLMKGACLLVVCAAALLVLGCGGDNAGDATNEAPSAEQIISDASMAVEELNSFHFELTHENGTTPLPLNLELEAAEGDVILPDRVSADLDAEASGINVNVQAVAIGPETWVTNPFTRQWEQLPGTDLRGFADIPTLLTTMLPAIQDPAVVGEEEVSGRETYEIQGMVPSSDLQAALPFSLPDREVTAHVWIGVEDSLPVRVRVIGPLVDGEDDDVVRQVDLSGFNQEVTIQPPE